MLLMNRDQLPGLATYGDLPSPSSRSIHRVGQHLELHCLGLERLHRRSDRDQQESGWLAFQ